jgi:release factor glutamine methyltransferase
VTVASERPPRDAWAVQRLLRWAAEDFEKRGSPTARLDAEVLLAHVLGTERIRLFVEAQRVLEEAELGAYRDVIRRRRMGEPVAYIVGRREFYGLDFVVDQRVLIPRPDTETLVEVALGRTHAWSMYGRALDLCTGSGCVAIAFGRQRPTWEVTGIDVSPNALEVARMNAQRLGAVHGVQFRCGDLMAPLDPSDRFELITANPPYIPTVDCAELEPGIRDFEPRLALDGGEDGLGPIRRIVAAARDHLVPGGILALEVGFDQATRVTDLLESAAFSDVERRRDYGGHERVVSGRQPESGVGVSRAETD